MSKPIPVHIFFVLDRSGSMQSIRSDVVGGCVDAAGTEPTPEPRSR